MCHCVTLSLGSWMPLGFLLSDVSGAYNCFCLFLNSIFEAKLFLSFIYLFCLLFWHWTAAPKKPPTTQKKLRFIVDLLLICCYCSNLKLTFLKESQTTTILCRTKATKMITFLTRDRLRQKVIFDLIWVFFWSPMFQPFETICFLVLFRNHNATYD